MPGRRASLWGEKTSELGAERSGLVSCELVCLSWMDVAAGSGAHRGGIGSLTVLVPMWSQKSPGFLTARSQSSTLFDLRQA